GVAKNEMVLKNFRTVLQVLLIQQRNKDLLITRFLATAHYIELPEYVKYYRLLGYINRALKLL
ncbi:hypothetical protein, partial [uncultured Pseudoalteromonas sp.]|uniref:hypothetical protein n=1 Tax=uncultured Pseudoalteromonas sp. TaxID=114053 RepID=UPI002613398C